METNGIVQRLAKYSEALPSKQYLPIKLEKEHIDGFYLLTLNVRQKRGITDDLRIWGFDEKNFKIWEQKLHVRPYTKKSSALRLPSYLFLARITAGTLCFNPKGTGTYYLVIDNTHSVFMKKEFAAELYWVWKRPVYAKGERIYGKGEVYDFYRDIRDITKHAKNEVFLIDSYVDEEALDLYIDKIPKGIKIRILTNKPQGQFFAVAKKFATKPNVDFEVRKNKDCHDRLFFIDNNCYIMGQSLKDAGKKPTYLVKIGSHNIFMNVFEKLWDESQQLI